MGEEASRDILGLYELAANVAIIKVNASQLGEYAEKHRKFLKAKAQAADIAPELTDAAGSLNDYLQKTLGSKKEYRNKVLIAEISGDIGTSFTTGGHSGGEEEHDYAGVDLTDADLAGSRLVELEFIEQRMSKINLRDCYFDKVKFVKCDVRGSDFRGTNIGDCLFYGYSRDDQALLSQVKLSYYDPNSVQDLGVFTIEDGILRAQIGLNVDLSLDQEKTQVMKARKEEFFRDLSKQQSYMSWAASSIFTTEFTRKKAEGEKAIEEKVNQEFAEKRAQLIKERSQDFIIRFQEPIADATYVPKENTQLAETPRYKVQVNKSDIEEYIDKFKQDGQLTFKSFIENKYRHAISKSGLGSVKIVPHLKGADLSAMTLVGIYDGTDFSYCNLTDTVLSDIRASGCSFEGATIPGAKFIESVLVDCNMTGIKGNEKTDFTKAVMLRARLEAAHVEKGIFNGAFMYSANITGANFSESFMQHVNLENSIAKRVNLSYADARYANFKKANLTAALLKETDLTEADLTQSIMQRADAEGAILEKAIMDEVQAQYASFKEAIMNEVRARNGNFTQADFEHLESAFKADFTNSIMNKIQARYANFTEAILHDVQAHGANFSRTCLDKVQAERFDITAGVMEGVSAHNANFQNAIIEKVKARNANFSEAILKGVKAQGADLSRAVLEAANLENLDIRAEANLSGADFRGAKCKGIQYDASTVLVDAHIQGAKDLDPALAQTVELQTKLFGKAFGTSKYGRCLNNRDGSNDRFKAQQIGAGVLVAAMSTAGYTLSGPLAGLSTAAIGGVLTKEMLAKVKDGELGYIDNVFGDKLAEIGVIAQGAGLKGIEGATYGTIAAAIASSTGLVTGGVTLGLGIIGTAGGAAIAYDGVKRGNKAEMAVGGLVAAGGVAASVVGSSSATGALATIGYGAAAGGIAGALRGAQKAISQLNNGMRPEEIYRANTRDFADFVQTITPNKNKIIAGIITGIVLAGVVCLATHMAIPALAIATIALSIAPICAAFGFVAGYFGQAAIEKKFFAATDTKAAEDKTQTAPKRERHTVSIGHAMQEGITTPSKESIGSMLQETTAALREAEPQAIPLPPKWTERVRPAQTTIVEDKVNDSKIAAQGFEKRLSTERETATKNNGISTPPAA